MPFSPHPYQHWLSPVPLIMAILTGLMNLKIYINVTYSFLIELFAYFSLLSCKSSLCSLNINSLSEYGLEIPSPISLLAFSFFLIVSFDMQNLFHLVKFPLVICAFYIISKKCLAKPMSKSFSHIQSSKSFTILSLIFILKLIFEWSKIRIKSHSFHVIIQFFQEPFLKNISFPIEHL